MARHVAQSHLKKSKWTAEMLGAQPRASQKDAAAEAARAGGAGDLEVVAVSSGGEAPWPEQSSTSETLVLMSQLKISQMMSHLEVEISQINRPLKIS